jgi:hypothetical protein
VNAVITARSKERAPRVEVQEMIVILLSTALEMQQSVHTTLKNKMVLSAIRISLSVTKGNVLKRLHHNANITTDRMLVLVLKNVGTTT